MSNRIVPLLLVGPAGLTAFFALDDEHRAFDAAEEFQGRAEAEELEKSLEGSR